MMLQPGDILIRNDGAYHHFGVYEGRSTFPLLDPTPYVIEFGGKAYGTPTIRRIPYNEFEQGRPVSFRVPLRPRPDVLATARSLLGSTNYDLFESNCEHFATWSADGVWNSEQAQRWKNLFGWVCGIGGLAIIASAWE